MENVVWPFLNKDLIDMEPGECPGQESARDELLRAIQNAIFKLEVMPSMRMLMTAGPALNRDNMAGYNCSFVAVDHPRAFDEILYILTCGQLGRSKTL